MKGRCAPRSPDPTCCAKWPANPSHEGTAGDITVAREGADQVAAPAPRNEREGLTKWQHPYPQSHPRGATGCAPGSAPRDNIRARAVAPACEHGKSQPSPLTHPRMTLAGNRLIHWPAICTHFGWDASKLCGPKVVAFKDGPAHCCYGHGAKHPIHSQQPKVNAKPFDMQEHLEALEAKGLVTTHDELRQDRKADRPPPGKATKNKHGASIYPARHFA